MFDYHPCICPRIKLRTRPSAGSIHRNIVRLRALSVIFQRAQGNVNMQIIFKAVPTDPSPHIPAQPKRANADSR